MIMSSALDKKFTNYIYLRLMLVIRLSLGRQERIGISFLVCGYQK